MAKVKTAQQLQEEAKRVIEEAKKAQRELLKRAKEVERDAKVELADLCLKFLKGKSSEEDLMKLAKKLELVSGEEFEKNENKKVSSETENENQEETFSEKNENSFDESEERNENTNDENGVKTFSQNY